MSIERRRAAAAKYRPDQIRTLLVAEAPPANEDRYFYFEDVPQFDALFRGVAKAVLGAVPPRERKAEGLRQLQACGFYLIDLSEEPVGDRRHLRNLVDDLVERCRALSPRCIVLIKVNVFDLCFDLLRADGFPVAPVRIPFPGSGRQREFEVAVARALEKCT